MKTDLELELGVQEAVTKTRAARWSSPTALASLPKHSQARTLSGPAQQWASHLTLQHQCPSLPFRYSLIRSFSSTDLFLLLSQITCLKIHRVM